MSNSTRYTSTKPACSPTLEEEACSALVVQQWMAHELSVTPLFPSDDLFVTTSLHS